MNRHYLEWLQAHPQQGIVARSEDMMSPEDARQQYQRIGEHFDLQRRSEHIYVLQRRVNDTQQFLRRLMNFGYCAQRQ